MLRRMIIVKSDLGSGSYYLLLLLLITDTRAHTFF